MAYRDLLLQESAKVEALIKNSLARKSATGNLVNSIKVSFNNRNAVVIRGADYADDVFYGRRPGKLPPVDAIRRWARTRGIDEKYVWAIAKSIQRKGIKGFDYLVSTRAYIPILRDNLNRQVLKDILRKA